MTDKDMTIIKQTMQMFPQQRLGQLVSNAARYAGWVNPDLFYIPDGILIEGFKIMMEDTTGCTVKF